jgi:hypothetical protein
MTASKDLINDIEDQMGKVANITPFNSASFGDLDYNSTFPAIQFILKSRGAFDPPHRVHSTMQLRWELVYDVQVMYSRLHDNKSWKEARELVDTAVDIFVNQMAEAERLNGTAWYIEPEDVQYGVIVLEPANRNEYLLGGVFTLRIKFLQDVS